MMVGSVLEVGRMFMKKDNILTKKAKQCLTCRNFIYDESLMVLRGLEWYARDVKPRGGRGRPKAGGGWGRWWNVKSPLARFYVLRGAQIICKCLPKRMGYDRQGLLCLYLHRLHILL